MEDTLGQKYWIVSIYETLYEADVYLYEMSDLGSLPDS